MPNYRGGGRGYRGGSNSSGGRYHGGSGNRYHGRGGRSSGRGGRGGGRGGSGGIDRNHPNNPLVIPCEVFISTGVCERHKAGTCDFNHSIQCLSTVRNSKQTGNKNKNDYNNYNNRDNSNHQWYHSTSCITPWLEKPDAPLKIFTASHDGYWRLYNTTNGQFNVEVEHNLNGKIHTILVKHSFLFCGFEAVSTKIPNSTVGMILVWNLANPSDQPMELHMGSTPASSALAPYAHSKGVTSLITHDDVCFSGGQDHIIRVWKFDPTMNQNKGGFKLIKECCGHVGDVTGLVFCNGMLWSCSVDGTIRIWDSNSNWECKHLIVGSEDTDGSNGGPGHKGPITTLLHFQNEQPQQGTSPTAGGGNTAGTFIFSASLDGTVKVWDCANGNCLSSTHPLSYGITSMALMKEPKGGRPILILGTEYGAMHIMSILGSPNAGAMSILMKIDKKFVNVGHSSGAIYSVATGPPNTSYANTFYTGGADGNMIIWQLLDDFGMT